MAGRYECLVHYQRLLTLLEEDYETFPRSVDGEIKELYLMALMREITALKENMSRLPNY